MATYSTWRIRTHRAAILAIAALLAMALAWPTPSMADHKVVRAGVFDIEPLCYKGEDGQHEGLGVEVLKYVAGTEGWDLEFVDCRFAECLTMLHNGELDVMPIIAYSLERAERFDFTRETLFIEWGEVYVRPGAAINTVLDLDGARVAMLEDSIQVGAFLGLVSEFGIRVEPLYVKDYKGVFEAVELGRAQALVVNRVFALRNAHRYDVKKTPIIFSPIDIRMATPKGRNLHMRRAIDAYLGELKADEDSVYHEAVARMFGGVKGREPMRLPGWLVVALVAGGVLAALSLGINVYLDHQVGARTRELQDEISRRRKAQKTLAALFESLPQMIFHKDTDSVYISCNRRYADDLGIPPESIAGKTDYDLHPLELAEKYRADDREVLRTGITRHFEEEYRRGGTPRIVQTIKAPVKDEGGAIVGLIGVFQDITDRKRTEEAVFQAKQDWEETFDTITDMITIHDRDFNVTRANRAASETLGLPWAMVNRAKCHELYHGADAPPANCASCQSLKTGRTTVSEFYEPHLGKHLEVTAIPRFDIRGEITGLIHIVRDISERKAFDRALEESERKYRMLFNQSPVPVFVLDAETQTILAVNDAAVRSYGYGRLELLGMTASDIKAEPPQGMPDSHALGEDICLHRHRDGTLRHVQVTSYQIEYEGRGARLALAHDISDRFMAEQALRESERRFRELSELLPAVIFECDPRGRLSFLNRYGFESMGLAEGDLGRGVQLENVLIPNDVGRARADLEAILGGSPVMGTEYMMRGRGGTSVPVLMHAALIEGPGGPLGIRGVAVDISRLREAEMKLSHRQGVLQSVYKMATTYGSSLSDICSEACLMLSDLMGTRLVSVVQIEPSTWLACAMGGRLMDTESLAPGRCGCREQLSGKGHLQYAGELARQVAASCPLGAHGEFQGVLSVPVLDSAQGVLGAICLMDTSERVFSQDDVRLIEIYANYIAIEMERAGLSQRLRDAQKMEAIGALAGDVAHEVRNPLNAIIAISDALEHDLDGNPGYTELLFHLRGQAERLAALMRDLLELGKPIDTGSMTVEVLLGICRSAVSLWEGNPSARGRRPVEILCRGGLEGATVRADQKRLQQVLLNLLDNASEHSGTETPVTLSIENGAGSTLRLLVTDRGSGVHDDVLPRVFDTFYSTRRGGTGLGLSIVRHIIEKHGGSVSLYNNEDGAGGCTFEAVLPMADLDG